MSTSRFIQKVRNRNGESRYVGIDVKVPSICPICGCNMGNNYEIMGEITNRVNDEDMFYVDADYKCNTCGMIFKIRHEFDESIYIGGIYECKQTIYNGDKMINSERFSE